MYIYYPRVSYLFTVPSKKDKINQKRVAYTQLDCPSDGHWDYAGIFAVDIRFQIRDQFWIPQPKLHWVKYLIFCKT